MKLKRFLSKAKETAQDTADYVKTKKLEMDFNKESREVDWLSKKDREIKTLQTKHDRIKQKADKYKQIDKLKKGISKSQGTMDQKRRMRSGSLMGSSGGSMFRPPEQKDGFEGIRKKRRF